MKVAALLLVLIMLSSGFLESTAQDDPAPEMCNTKCGERCSKALLKKKCVKKCGVCCAACNCVPARKKGTDDCPCYKDMKKKNKCP